MCMADCLADNGTYKDWVNMKCATCTLPFCKNCEN